MVDSSKRRSLKSIGGMMAIPFVSAAAIPAISQAKEVDTQSLKDLPANGELQFTLELGDKPMMRVTNKSNSMVILRSVHPGVVHAGDKSYDLNHALMSSSYAVRAGGSRLLAINEALGPVAEPERVGQRTLRLASISTQDIEGRTMNASRAFFA